jgi:hypothetical protein
MSEVIYVLTIIYAVYVIYVAEGDNIVAFIKDVFGLDLSHPHNSCSQALNRIRNLGIFKSG